MFKVKDFQRVLKEDLETKD